MRRRAPSPQSADVTWLVLLDAPGKGDADSICAGSTDQIGVVAASATANLNKTARHRPSYVACANCDGLLANGRSQSRIPLLCRKTFLPRGMPFDKWRPFVARIDSSAPVRG